MNDSPKFSTRRLAAVWRVLAWPTRIVSALATVATVATVAILAFDFFYQALGVRAVNEIEAFRPASDGNYWEASTQFCDPPSVWIDLGIVPKRKLMHIVDLSTAHHGYPSASDPARRAEAIRFWGAVARLPCLRCLDARSGPFSDADLPLIAGSDTLAFLNLVDTKITDAGLLTLARMSALRWLVVDSRTISAEAVAALTAARPSLGVHRTTRGVPVDMYYGTLEPPAWLADAVAEACGPISRWQAPLRAIGMPRIREKSDLQAICSRPYTDFISLCDRPFEDADLLGVEGLNTVVYLGLSRTKVTGAGLANLVGLRSLLCLHIDDRLIREGATPHLQKMKRLQFLALEDHTLSDAEFARLQRDLPGVEILRRERIETPHLSLRGGFQMQRRAPPWVCGRYGEYFKDSDIFSMFDVPVATWLGSNADDEDVAGIIHLRDVTSLHCKSVKVHGSAIGRLTQLKELEIEALAGEPDGWAFLSGLRALEKLRIWRRGETTAIPLVTDRTLAAIALLSRLDSLNFGPNPGITDAGVGQMRRLARLTWLNLDGAPIGDAAAAVIADLPAMRRLFLQSTRVGDQGLKRLATLPKLAEIGLSGTHVGDEGVKHLAGAHALVQADLQFTRVGDAGVAALSTAPALKKLWLRGTRVTRKGAESLRKFTGLESVNIDGRLFREHDRREFARQMQPAAVSFVD